MRKSYLWILSLVLTMFTGLNAFADMTINVNQGGIVTLLGKTLPEGDTVYSGYDWCGALTCEKTYKMTVTNDLGESVLVQEDSDQFRCEINPATAGFTATKLFVVVEENAGGGGGGGEDPVVEQQHVTFLFVPEGCGYVTVTHPDDQNNNITEDFTEVNDDAEIVVPFYSFGRYVIKPNEGFILDNAIDESERNNPHSSPITANGLGYIDLSNTYIGANSTFIVSAKTMGSFTIKGVGERVADILMFEESDASKTISVTDTEQTIQLNEAKTYKIQSTSAYPLWKVEVTNDGETELLEGIAGNFFYTPDNGDQVVIYTDVPETHAKLKLTIEGDGVENDIIDSITYSNSEVAEATWSAADGWIAKAGGEIVIKFNTAKYVGLGCTINGVSQNITSSYPDGKPMVRYTTYNDDPATAKEFEIVVTARQEKVYAVTLVCEHPEIVSITGEKGVIPFTTSPTTISVRESKNQLRFATTSGDWKIASLTVNDEDAADFLGGLYSVTGDCTIQINLTDLSAIRTKTAVVYVDETVAKPTYLSVKYGDQTEVPVAPGYNFVKYCDEDLPLSLGYYYSGDAAYYVNGEKVTMVSPCPETQDLEDGSVIKIFNTTPTANVLSYNLAEDVKALVEIYHDHTSKIDLDEATEHACFPGTQVHIKPVAAAPTQARTRAEAVSAIDVVVNDEKLVADADGVYSFKVTDAPLSIKVTKNTATGIDEIAAAGETVEVYNLQGIVVKKSATADDVKNLPAGLYIVGGKKVTVK